MTYAATASAVDLPFDEAVDFFLQKTRKPTDYWTDVWEEAHSKSFMVAGATEDALLADFQAEIAKALTSGTTLEEFRQGFDSIVAKHGWDYNGSRNWRSRIIYETNLSTAYSAGRWAQQTDPDVASYFPYLIYHHSGSANPRLDHLSWDGLVLSIDDDFWKTHYPPNGWKCGCWVESVSRAEAAALGKTGPDKSPRISYESWMDPKTGEMKMIPEGIDPGFGYNPGRSWLGDPTSAPAAKPPPTAPIPPIAKPVNPQLGGVVGQVTDDYTLGEQIKQHCAQYMKNSGGKLSDVIFETGKRYFMATNCRGAVWINDRDFGGFNAAREIRTAWNKIAKGDELTWNEEYSVEGLWHEIQHNRQVRTGPLSNRQKTIMETVNQWTARRAYPDFLKALGGKAAHWDDIKINGKGYKGWVRNFDALAKATGVDEMRLQMEMERLLRDVPMNGYEVPLRDFIHKETGAPKKALQKLMGRLTDSESLFSAALKLHLPAHR